MSRLVVNRPLWSVVLLLPSIGFAQTADQIVSHPALGTVSHGSEAMRPAHQLGKFGESFVGENLRASGFDVYDANLNDRGIDLLAVRRDPQGSLIEVQPVEVKTRSRGIENRLGMTQEGRQLSAEWTERRLARLAREHSDPRLRQLASEILTLKQAHPEMIRPQLHSLSIGDNSYRVFRVDPKSGAVEGLLSESSVTRMLRRISEADVNPTTRRAAIQHLQQFDQVQASVLGCEASSPVAATRSATAANVEASQLPGAAKALPGAASEAGAAESGILAKALPVAAKTVAVAAAVADVGIRGYQACGVEQQYQRGEISDRERVIAHAKNGGGMACGWGGAVALGSQGAAWGSALGPLGAAGGGFIGGAAGYFGGEKLAEIVVDQGAAAIYAGVNAARDGAAWFGSQATHVWGITKSHLGW